MASEEYEKRIQTMKREHMQLLKDSYREAKAAGKLRVKFMHNGMFGAIIGDLIGSSYEGKDQKGYNLPFFTELSHPTDETYLLDATNKALSTSKCFASDGIAFGQFYRDAYFNSAFADDYGHMFRQWAEDHTGPYQSYGNGAASRVAPVAFYAESEAEVLDLAELSAKCTHNSEEGVKGAQAVALSVYLAKQGQSADEIRDRISHEFYPLYYDLEDLHNEFGFSTDAETTVPVAIWIACTSDDFKEVMSKGLYIGGDTDTILSIAGAIAGELYGIPEEFSEPAHKILKEYSVFYYGE
ncbi:ADP-ribosylglycohydrolase family protein (plasmid) [Neptuniibacter sp. QD72_48]|uniref:ADP-ribosylglycohydrolase family protein n=1 Tax=Neptuniibacter sp. QD72_48 TaxID=3398214 RepID=UPI0039F5E998